MKVKSFIKQGYLRSQTKSNTQYHEKLETAIDDGSSNILIGATTLKTKNRMNKVHFLAMAVSFSVNISFHQKVNIKSFSLCFTLEFVKTCQMNFFDKTSFSSKWLEHSMHAYMCSLAGINKCENFQAQKLLQLLLVANNIHFGIKNWLQVGRKPVVGT